jgi:hypothetical protein
MARIRVSTFTDLQFDPDRDDGRIRWRGNRRPIRPARARGSDRADVSCLPADMDEWTYRSSIAYTTPAVEAAVREGRVPCPVCGGSAMAEYRLGKRSGRVPTATRARPATELCECDRCGCDARLPRSPDGLPTYPGLPVGAAMDPDRPLEEDAPKYRPDPGLSGGKGGGKRNRKIRGVKA